MHQPTVSTATSDPSVCIPEPNVRSHGTKMALLIVGGMAKTNTAADTIHTARVRVSRVLSVSPATSTSNAPTSDRYPAPNRPTKKRQPKNAPAGIAANTFGSVAKINPGPDVGCRPEREHGRDDREPGEQRRPGVADHRPDGRAREALVRVEVRAVHDHERSAERQRKDRMADRGDHHGGREIDEPKLENVPAHAFHGAGERQRAHHEHDRSPRAASAARSCSRARFRRAVP